jgi:hypothetical protein
MGIEPSQFGLWERVVHLAGMALEAALCVERTAAVVALVHISPVLLAELRLKEAIPRLILALLLAE